MLMISVNDKIKELIGNFMIMVNCTLVQALSSLCIGRMAHRGSRGIALLYRH